MTSVKSTAQWLVGDCAERLKNVFCERHIRTMAPVGADAAMRMPFEVEQAVYNPY